MWEMCAGVSVLGEVNIPTTYVMNVLWLLGTFTFATLLGFITEDIVNYVMVRMCFICRMPYPLAVRDRR